MRGNWKAYIEKMQKREGIFWGPKVMDCQLNVQNEKLFSSCLYYSKFCLYNKWKS